MLQKIEEILGVSNDQVTTLLELMSQRLRQKLGGIDEVPEELEYIVIEATVRRFNRIGSEGTSSHNVEGENMSWSSQDDFEGFEEDINDWLIAQEDATKGVVRFL